MIYSNTSVEWAKGTFDLTSTNFIKAHIIALTTGAKRVKGWLIGSNALVLRV